MNFTFAQAKDKADMADIQGAFGRRRSGAYGKTAGVYAACDTERLPHSASLRYNSGQGSQALHPYVVLDAARTK